jgi:hypothetical protein
MNLYYSTIAEFARQCNVLLTKRELNEYGRAAKRLSDERSVRIGETPNSHYGKVNMYRSDILFDIFFEPTTRAKSHGKEKKQNDRQQQQDSHTQGQAAFWEDHH